MLRLLPVLLLACAARGAMLVEQGDLGLRIAEGFKVSLLSRSAEDCMRLDESGELLRAPANTCLSRIGPDGAVYTTDGQAVFRAGKKIADGFGKLRGFDFNSAGDLFVFDADVERDFFLPWYVPTRIYHVAIGQNHGWLGSVVKPEYYPDSVEVLAPIGRATPGGVAIYRHNQFPAEYRDGLFLCDEDGKLYFCKVQKAGSTYRPRLDLFLEGTNLAPRQVMVDPAGALIVLTRNSILKIEHPGERGQSLSMPTRVQEVLRTPQPLEAWSRAKWIPAAKQLEADAFSKAINDTSLSDAERVRAVEIHRELFGDLPNKVLEEAAVTKSAPVRARVAWALAQQLNDDNVNLMRRLAADTDATVRRFALETLLIAQPNLGPSFFPILRQNLDHPDKRLRQATARLCARLPDEDWAKLWDPDAAFSPQTELSILQAGVWRNPPASKDQIFWRALETLPLARDRFTRVQAMRLMTISQGDWTLRNPSSEAFAAYELSDSPTEEMVTNALPFVRRVFQSADGITEIESARLLAMLRDDSEETVRKIEKQFDGQNSPTATFHYLIALARLRGTWPETLAPKVAEFIRTFEKRLNERERSADQNWPERLKETTAALVEREPRLQTLMETPATPP